ncbi:hypothetical protein ACH5RR_035204 [Cinchona calisaya]|uniref:SWIRM domain-containing protein n=1 Tax=Cinchona calisaya TaxID=153742 RepID=A0ABD2YD57_9GENT
MEGEEKNKFSFKRRAKKIEIGLESDDDELIGSFLKLKSKRNSKKNKAVSAAGDKGKGIDKLLVEDEDLVGMDDTLASFRKKLRAPKKDDGSVLMVGGDLGSNLAELMSQSVAEKVGVDDGGGGYTVDKGLGVGARKKNRRSKVELASNDVGADFDSKTTSHCWYSGDNSSQKENESALGRVEVSVNCLDDGLEDSISAFLHKAQSGLIGKSLCSLRLRSGKETQVFKDGVSGDFMPELARESGSASELARKSGSALELANEMADSNLDLHVSSMLEDNKTDDILQVKFPSSNSRQELCSAPVMSDGTCRSSGNVDDKVSGSIPENSVPMSVLRGSQSSLRACSDTIMKVQDSGFTSQTQVSGAPGHCPGKRMSVLLHVAEVPFAATASEELESHHIHESVLAENNDQKLWLNSVSRNDTSNAGQRICSRVGKQFLQVFSDHESLNRSCDAPHKRYPSNDHDGPNQVRDNCTGVPDASVSSEKEGLLEGSLSPVSACGTTKHEFAPGVKQQDTTLWHGGDSNQFLQCQTPNDSVALSDKHCSALYGNKPFDGVSKDASLQGSDYFPGEEEAKGVSSPSDMPDSNESYVEDAGICPGPESKTKSTGVGERRKPRKRRLGDMAYEGDADWEILIHDQDFLIGHQVGDSLQSYKTRGKLNSSTSITLDADNGGAAAISAGLKARAVGPVEKIKFKEVLKHKGGLQEYLEYRNNILSLWNKDVSRILPLSDCGVSDTPLVDNSPRASLVRDIYAFLDQCGYINFGVASEKAVNGSAHNLKLLKEENFAERSGAPVADANDGVCFILGKLRNTEISRMENNSIALNDEKRLMAKTKLDERHVDFQPIGFSAHTGHEGFPADNCEENGDLGAKIPGETVSSSIVGSNPSSEDEKIRILPVANPDLCPTGEAEVGKSFSCSLSHLPEGCSNFQSTWDDDRSHFGICELDARKRIIVVGAGPAGLTAARHLHRQGFHVTMLEARSRIGGRVFTDRSSLSVPVDLGASIITGVEADVATERRADPSSLVCAQLGLELTVLNSDCPLYDTVTGQKVPANIDETLEAEYNSLLDDMVLLVAQKGENAIRMSLEEGLEYALKRRRMAHCARTLVDSEQSESLDTVITSERVPIDDEVPEDHSCKTEILAPLERRVMDWHFANLEYGCAALLKEVSLPYWNQDDDYGGFGGAHCMIKGGYSTVIDSLGEGLRIHLNHIVTDIRYTDAMSNSDQHKVKVLTSNGSEFSGDAVLITVPLGCLKAETIKFSPPLPQWKFLSIQRLGFGVLNKVVMEFSEVFWDDSIDYFGATAEETTQRGWCFMFWNVKKTVGAPVLIALVVGKAAIDGQSRSSSDHVNHALFVLRKLFGETAVPDPVASVVTDWGGDPYSYGAYSYVAVGSSGEDYDLLGRPVENCLFFAGEATCKEHPDTVGGAMMSGLREAVRIIDILNTGTDYTAEVEAMEAAKRHSDNERSEIRDIINRLEAIELSNVLCKNSFDQTQILTKESLLQDLFYSAKTTVGRLHVAKQLLKLPVQVLKSFAGNKEGLTVLNSWMLDSMGKDGTQLLRHCVRLLVLVSTDLLAVRLSGIGKTVKEKVCVHTSRDIRAIASQLVSVWIEIFRKEKASNGGLKLLRQPTGVDSFKGRSSQAPGKPPLRTNHITLDNRGSAKVSSRNLLASSTNSKKSNMVKPVKFETFTDSKLEVKASSSEGSVGRQNAAGEEHTEFPMSEEERAAFAAAEAARAAALAAEEAYASSGAKSGMSLQLPKIPSFNKFARREQYARMDESDIRRNWSGGVFGKQDCLSEIDSRNCRVRDWSVDFSAAGVNLDTSKMSVDNCSQQSHSNEIACQLNFSEHSGENVAVDSSFFTTAWIDGAGSVGIKDYNDIARWQCQAAAANSDFFHHQTMHITDEEDSTSKLPTRNRDGPTHESSASQVTVNKELVKNRLLGAERIKQAVVEYVASLLMPLYKARKIDREGYKSIMKKSATKVMEQATDAEKAMAVFEFLDSKRKNKIRAFVDRLIERHMAMKPAVKS